MAKTKVKKQTYSEQRLLDIQQLHSVLDDAKRLIDNIREEGEQYSKKTKSPIRAAISIQVCDYLDEAANDIESAMEWVDEATFATEPESEVMPSI